MSPSISIQVGKGIDLILTEKDLEKLRNFPKTSAKDPMGLYGKKKKDNSIEVLTDLKKKDAILTPAGIVAKAENDLVTKALIAKSNKEKMLSEKLNATPKKPQTFAKAFLSYGTKKSAYSFVAPKLTLK